MSTDPLIGRRLANFQIERPLGRGGMAQVYYGQDVKLRRPVAIKVIDARFRDEPSYAKRFVREAQSIATWRHENIVQIYYADDEEGIYYYVMEYIDGGDLGDLMAGYRANGELIPHDEIIRIGRAIAGALDYAHKQGLIHRDVKPANVMVANEDGRVVVTDFGLAMDVEMGSMGEVFGSARYVAPEQARNSANAVPQSDLYALGIILYEMLTGKVPFDDPSSAAVAIQHLTLSPPPPRQVNPEIDEDTEAVLLKALSKSPEERFQTGRELMDALEAALSGSTIMFRPSEQATKPAVSPPPPKTTPDRPPAATTPDKPPVTTPPTETTPQPATSSAGGLDPKVMAGIGAAVVLLLLFIGFMALGGGDEEPEPTEPAAVSEATTAQEAGTTPEGETSEDTPGEAELLPTAEIPEAVAEPTPTPEPEPTVLADSSADFAETPTNNWEYLWFNARDSEQWQSMQYYSADHYGRPCHYTNPKHVRICEGFGNPGNQDDLAWRWTSEVSGMLELQVQARKVGNGGDGVKITVYRDNTDSDTFPLFEKFTNQGLINESITVEDVSPDEQFYFVMNKNQTETLDDTEFNVKICHYECP